MALELRQSLHLAQQLIMTPQLQQAIKLLQLSRLELLETISQEMETNPVLEEQVSGDAEDDRSSEEDKETPDQNISDPEEVTVEERARDDVDWENYVSEYSSGWPETPSEEREMPSLENVISTKPNLYSHLIWQLKMSDLDEEQTRIGSYIIWNLNEDGYLDTPLEEVCYATGFGQEQVLEVLHLIQHFDPVGVAARDMRESLLIQAMFQNLQGTIVEKIISDHLRDLENKKYDDIAKKLGVPNRDVLTAISIIQGLEPKPGRSYSDEQINYIIPDIYVFEVGDNYEIVQNEDGLPKLRINSYYKDILRSNSSMSESAKAYIQEKLRSAAWLIKSIHQRQRTIYRVTESIFRFQRLFLDDGITKLRPLVLRDVAEDIEMHESTVSRVTTNKYVHTPQGVFELKFFFNSMVSSFDGNAIASESVKQHIRNIINSEKKNKPFSDKEVVDILKKMNIKIARRTVAKYRESMGILPSRKRKEPWQMDI
jgi:RNA polymerase sigma-54 factor